MTLQQSCLQYPFVYCIYVLLLGIYIYIYIYIYDNSSKIELYLPLLSFQVLNYLSRYNDIVRT